ncbi:MAG: Uma2 family endonuclease [Phycisphaerae bacterium]|nr:Uma2 family endonuclease [Phycisphaerae bacterium]
MGLPAASTAADLLTVDDCRATPEGSRFQLVEGEPVLAPAANLSHRRIVRNLSQILCGHVAKSGVGEVWFAPCDVFPFPHDVVQPDLFLVARDRLGLLPEDGLHRAPDLAIEVVSPGSALLDKKQERRLYARSGGEGNVAGRSAAAGPRAPGAGDLRLPRCESTISIPEPPRGRAGGLRRSG